jgi:hypothetical protein
LYIKKDGNPIHKKYKANKSSRTQVTKEHNNEDAPQLYTNKREDHKLLRTCCVAHTCLFMFISMFRVMNDWMKTKKDFGD